MTAVLLAFAWALGFVFFAVTLPQDPPDETVSTDAIVVFTGGSLRLEAGLRLLSAGKARKLFISGVHRGVDVEELKRVWKQAPETVDCCIVLGYEADDTSGNARESADWVNGEGYRSIRLVTADYHMPRSLIEFRMLAPEVTVIPHPVHPPHVKTSEWYKYPGTALLIAGEYTKTLVAVVRVWIRRGFNALLADGDART
ncbi:YdcF family protein [Hwanghaeella sp.]|uniref:YdcF family protein n=1 Tax=Hwanghaeella sp. TaxID=2605943 RepID=UPI003CCBBE05